MPKYYHATNLDPNFQDFRLSKGLYAIDFNLRSHHTSPRGYDNRIEPK
jgi:hypothetical protein